MPCSSSFGSRNAASFSARSISALMPAYGVAEAQVEEIEREGLDKDWPPLE